MPNKKSKSADLQGITRLIKEATLGITDLVEAMHRRVVHPPMLPSTPIQHLITDVAGVAYKSVRWGTRLIGGGVDKALGQLTSVLGEATPSPEKEGLRSVLNGVVGDYLEESDNPLAIRMQFRYQGEAIALNQDSLAAAYPAINGKILLLIHGSCMNDLQWTRKEHNHGTALAAALGFTPVYLHYNSGRHVSTNGKSLSDLLEELTQNWPVAVEDLTILAHSMGGLVARSAVYYGQETQKTWPQYLKSLVFLGTPHHGAPLEKAGNYLDVILEAIPYAKPFARLGKIRSAGVTDLRYGNLLDEDWQDTDRFERQADNRQDTPLPASVACYSIAGVAGQSTESASAQFIGDNMVGLKSALGQHKDPSKSLAFPKKNTWIALETTHSDLLSSLDVYTQVEAFLNPDSDALHKV